MDIDRDRDRPREGFERVRARRRDGPPHRWTARWMDTHKKNMSRSASRFLASRVESRARRASYLGRVEDVRVVRALDRLRALRGFQGDGVSREDGAAGDLGAGGATRLAAVTLGQKAEVLRTNRAPSRSPEDALLLGSGLTPSTLGFTSVCWASVRGLALTKELAGSIRASGTLA